VPASNASGFEKIPPTVSAGLRRRSQLRQLGLREGAAVSSSSTTSRDQASVDLYWLPLVMTPTSAFLRAAGRPDGAPGWSSQHE
jgi:hypothetical protein